MPVCLCSENHPSPDGLRSPDRDFVVFLFACTPITWPSTLPAEFLPAVRAVLPFIVEYLFGRLITPAAPLLPRRLFSKWKPMDRRDMTVKRGDDFCEIFWEIGRCSLFEFNFDHVTTLKDRVIVFVKNRKEKKKLYNLSGNYVTES